MCRWFAYISPSEPCLLSDALITPAHSITNQVSEHYLPGLLPHGKDRDLAGCGDALVRLRNSLLNFDGLGVAFYTPTASLYSNQVQGIRPCLYKSSNNPKNDFNFHGICENNESTCIFAHVRASSGSAITPINSHPFVFGRHVFGHNGTIDHFSFISRDLSRLISMPAWSNIKGTTDSEHAAALYMTYLCGSDATASAWEQKYTIEEMRAAMQRTVVTIMTVTKNLLGSKARPQGLNFMATDGDQLVSCRFRNHATEQPSSLYWTQTAGTKLNRKYPGHSDGADLENPHQVYGTSAVMGKHTIVSSEPTTYDEKEWTLIPKNHMLLVDDKGEKTEVPLVYDVSLNAEIHYPYSVLHPQSETGEASQLDDAAQAAKGDVEEEQPRPNAPGWTLVEKSQVPPANGVDLKINAQNE